MPGPAELGESEKGYIAREVAKQTRYAVPHRAYVTYVYEHTESDDEWNHEVDVRLLDTVADDPREFEVPVMAPSPGEVTLPNDRGRNFDLTDREGPGTPEKKATEKGDTEKFHNFPVSTPRRRLDEVRAARQPVLRWKEA